MLNMPQRPKLSNSSFSPIIENTYKGSFNTTGSTFGLAIICILLLCMAWRYQHFSYKKTYNIDNENTKNVWDTRNKMLEIQRQQEANLRDMQSYYYYNNLHPQQKINQILKQNNSNDIESFVDESIAERLARPRFT